MKFHFRFEDERTRGYPSKRFATGFMCERRLRQKTMTEDVVYGYGVYLRLFGKALVLFYVIAKEVRHLRGYVEVAE
jgi:hypothetical protein